MATTTTSAPRRARGEVVSRERCAVIFGVAKTTLDAWVERGCPVHRPSPRRGVPAQFDTAAVATWRMVDVGRYPDELLEPEPPTPPAWEALDRLDSPVDKAFGAAQLTVAYELPSLVAVWAVEAGVPMAAAFRLSATLMVAMDVRLSDAAREFGLEPCASGEPKVGEDGQGYVDLEHLDDDAFAALNWPWLALKAGEPDWTPPFHDAVWPEFSAERRAQLVEQGRRKGEGDGAPGDDG